MVDQLLHQKYTAPGPGSSNRIAELQLAESATFNGADFIANSAPDALVEPLADGRYIAVTTPPANWSYAAHLLLEGRDLPTTGRLLLRVDLWVSRGFVNVGVIGPDDQFIAHETRSVGDGRTAVNLFVNGEDRPDQVVIRSAGYGAARAVVERAQAYCILEDAFAEVALLQSPTRVSRSSQPLARAFGVAQAASLKASTPLVSLILTVKNGLPYLNDALESIRCQSYRNIELVVQDCLSTDGSSELLARFDGVPTDGRREADAGIGDANNRALSRCHGCIVGSIDSDNLLDTNAVARAVDHFQRNPNDAVAFGSVRVISADGTEKTVFRPGPFDFLSVLACDLVVPWSTAFFNKPVCGNALRLDPMLKTCADYDVWLRLSHLPIAFIDEVQNSTRLSDSSMTCRPENYEQFCGDKIFALRRYAEACAHESLRAALIRHGVVGIYCWAAESVRRLAPERGDMIAAFHDRAKAIDPASSRVALAAARLA